MSTVFQSLAFSLENRKPYTPEERYGQSLTHEAIEYAQSGTLVHLAGRTLEGSSVHVCVYGYRPVFYVRVLYKQDSGSGVGETLLKLGKSKEFEPWMIHSEERVQRRIYQGFRNGESVAMWRVTAANVNAQRKITAAIESANKDARTAALESQAQAIRDERHVARRQARREAKLEARRLEAAADFDDDDDPAGGGDGGDAASGGEEEEDTEEDTDVDADIDDEDPVSPDDPEAEQIPYFPHFELFNTRIDPTCAFLHAAQLKPGGWVRVNSIVHPMFVHKYKPSKCSTDLLVNFAEANCLSSVEPGDPQYDKYASAIAPFRIMSFDIEAISQFDEASGRYPFPDADVHSNAISCICARIYTFRSGDAPTSSDYEDVAFTYRDCNQAIVQSICAREGVDAMSADPNAAVRVYKCERDMLRAFVRYFDIRGIDVLTGWNIMGFDLAYLFKRCKRHAVDMSIMSKFNTYGAPRLQNKVLDTAAAGHNEMSYFTMEGVLLLDELINVRRDVSLKLPSYRLDAIAEHYFSDHKVDMPPSEIHRLSQMGPDELAQVVGYCCKDAKLPMDIVLRRQSFLKTLMFAKLCLVPPSYVIERGAIVKSYSAIANAVHLKGWVVSDAQKPYNKLNGKYAGATVLDAKAGLYMTPIAGLDFASLYPSVMVSQFLDPQTFVEDDEYLGCPGVTYKSFEWSDDNRSYSYTIATSGEALIPDLLLELWAARKEAKKRIKQATTSSERAVHDASQMAIKVLMNSIYGAFGAVKTNGLAHLPIAMLTTYNGRCMIEEARRYTLARYGTYTDGSTFEQRVAKKSFAQLDEACTGGVDVVYGDTDSIMVKWQLPKGLDDRASLEYVFHPSHSGML